MRSRLLSRRRSSAQRDSPCMHWPPQRKEGLARLLKRKVSASECQSPAITSQLRLGSVHATALAELLVKVLLT